MVQHITTCIRLWEMIDMILLGLLLLNNKVLAGYCIVSLLFFFVVGTLCVKHTVLEHQHKEEKFNYIIPTFCTCIINDVTDERLKFNLKYFIKIHIDYLENCLIVKNRLSTVRK